MKNKKIQIDIGTNFFNEYFKNGIRDYYTYGFKSHDDFNESSGRTYIKWNMITSLLGDQWQYQKGKVKYISYKENAERMENPLNQLYFFHNGLNKGLIYFLILLELNDHVKLRDGLKSLGIDEEELKDNILLFENENENKYYRLHSWINNMNNYEKNKIRTTYQMKVILDRDLEVKRNISERDSYRKINNYMYFLRDKGLICNHLETSGNSNENS